jgi:hypothetical protein
MKDKGVNMPYPGNDEEAADEAVGQYPHTLRHQLGGRHLAGQSFQISHLGLAIWR